MRTRTRGEPLLSFLTRCLLFGAVVGLAACGGGGGGGSTSDPPVADVKNGALHAAAEGEVAAYFRERLARRPTTPVGGVAVPVAPSPAPGALTDATAVSGTRLQEAGVDEDDILKSDGTMLYALHPGRWVNGVRQPAQLQAARIRADGPLEPVGRTDLRSGFFTTGMYLTPQRLAILSQDQPEVGILDPVAMIASDALVLPSRRRTVAIDVYGTGVGAMPAPQHRMEMDGWMVGSRRIGDVLYVVNSWTPDLSAYTSTTGTGSVTATLTASALLPTVRVDGAAAEPLVRETDCFLQPDNASLALQLTTITAIDLGSPGLARSSRCYVGDAATLYMSPDNVYVASSRQAWIAAAGPSTVYPPEIRTEVHKFSLRGLQLAYRGSGSVAGHLGWDPEKMPYRMSEYQGDLRVLTFTGPTGWWGMPASTTPTTAPSPATLTVLREDAASGSLAAVATLPNAQRPQPLGHAGEQVYAVQFAGARGYVVTFRRTDPLYVLDLSVPADPKAVGELAMPGYSDYLYPLANGKLFGVGRDASDTGTVRGLKFALFDVADPAQPRVLATSVLGGAGSTTALDRTRHGIDIFETGTQARIALPVLVTRPAAVGGFAPDYQGLSRWEVDTVQGTLTQRPTVIAGRFDGTAGDTALFQRLDLGWERSVQSVLGAYYLSGGQVVYAPRE